MLQRICLLLLPLALLFSSAYAEDDFEPSLMESHENDGDLLERLLQEIDRVPSELLETETIFLAQNGGGESELTINLPGGGAVISSDELAADGPEELDEPEGFLINFNNLNVVEVIRFVSRITGKNFIFDENELDFAVTIVSEEPTSVDNVMAALLQVLKINNLQLIEQGNNYLIHRNPNVNRPSRIVDEENEGEEREATSLVTRVFRLERVPANSLSVIIRSMTSADALVETLSETNHLVITDLATNVSRVASFIRAIDGPGGQLDIGQYVTRNTHMVALIELAESLLAPIAGNDPIQLIPHTPTESIFIISTPYMVERAMSILQQLDLTGSETRIFSLKDLLYDPELESDFPEGSVDRRWGDALPSNDIRNTRFEFYKLQYRTATTVQSALQSIGSSIGSATDSLNTELIDAIESVQSIEESNMIVFTGTAAAVEVVNGFISRLDVPLRQVFIEMLILDTSIDKSMEFGVEWAGQFAGSKSTAGTVGFLGQGSAIPAGLTSLSTPNSDGVTIPAIDGLTNTTGFSVGGLGKVLTFGGSHFVSMSGFLRALQGDSDINVVMNPKIMTEDNTSAEVFVGFNTRFKTESVANESGQLITNNFEFRDVGSLLRVTPLLGDSDTVTLLIEQELSSGLGDVSSTDSTTGEEIGPVTKEIRTTTRVHIPDRQFLVMSGMITEERTRAKTAVPCLGGVPVAGSAFSRQNYRSQKRNLMLFIRPQIIDTEADIARITKDQRALYENKSKPKKKWKWEIDTGLDILNIKPLNMNDKDWGS